MNNHLNSFLFVASSTLLLASCGEDNTSFETPNTSGVATNSGTISQKHFSLLTADTEPAVIDATTGIFTKTDVELTVFIGDRNNNILTDAHTINFKTEYGLVASSCITEDGFCSVTWSAIKRPDFSIPGSPGADGVVTITAYTIGEEGFTDTNGNNFFDDADASFDDLEEPYVDANENTLYNIGDTIIDVVSTNDPTGANATHDTADGFYNGENCTHTSLCGIAKSITIFDEISMSFIANVPLSRTIGGDVAGLNITSTGQLILHNGSDNLPITANGPYTFPTTVADGQTYAVTVTNPTTPDQTCTVANATGTVSANVTTVDVTCAAVTYTIGGNLTGLDTGAGENVVLQNNNGNDLPLAVNGDFTFSAPIADGATYTVTIPTDTTAGATCVFNPVTSNTGDVTGANVTTVIIQC